MGRLGRRSALISGVALWCAALSAVLVAPGAMPAEATEGDALGAVAVPYLGTTTIEPAPGWRITDCDGPRAATPLVTSCEADRITLTATEYSPDAGPIVLPVPQSNGTTSTVFNYSVSLAAPEAPTVTPGRLGFPVAAGSTVMLPISELGVECAVCDEGGAIDVVGVEPASAGRAAANGTHVVFRPAAGFTGDAGVVVRFADDFGAWSAEVVIDVPVYRPDSSLVATSVYLERDGDEQAVDLGSLVYSSEDDDVVFLGCGAAVHGTVVCGLDGTARYHGAGAGVDQFSYHVASSSGEQATGSVTIIGDGEFAPAAGLVPASVRGDGDEGVASSIVPRTPVETVETGREGIFTPLIELLDRAGVR